jgi:hypothetical protein
MVVVVAVGVREILKLRHFLRVVISQNERLDEGQVYVALNRTITWKHREIDVST